jgi:tRNA threonylcarbamoyladenosine dehydratase
MLARAGVSRLLLIDFDQLTLSSLNRHALGTLADVGLPKTTVMLQHLSKIVPFSEIRVVNALFCSDNAEELLQGSPDFVLDCIDNIDTKIHLINHCLSSKIPLISSMGASGKADPSRIVIGDISESSEDPLARKCRQLLRAEMRQGGKFKCVYSLEKECTFGLIDNPESSEKRTAEGSDVNSNETTNDQSGKADGDYALLPKFRSRYI